MGQEIKAVALITHDKIQSEYSVNDDLEDELLASDNRGMHIKKEKEMVAHTPIDEMLLENNFIASEIVTRDLKFSSSTNTGTNISKNGNDVEYNDKRKIIRKNDCGEDQEDSLSEISSRNRTSLEGCGKYFGVNPVKIDVNRSFEINIDDPQHLAQSRYVKLCRF